MLIKVNDGLKQKDINICAATTIFARSQNYALLWRSDAAQSYSSLKKCGCSSKKYMHNFTSVKWYALVPNIELCSHQGGTDAGITDTNRLTSCALEHTRTSVALRNAYDRPIHRRFCACLHPDSESLKTSLITASLDAWTETPFSVGGA